MPPAPSQILRSAQDGLTTAAPDAMTPAADPWRARFRRWTGILAAYFSAQTLTQLTGLLAGLVLVRFLPVREFALYTLAVSVVGFFTFLSDLGSSSSLFHFFHRTADPASDEHGGFAGYRAAVLSLRRAAFLAGALAVVALFPWAAAAKGYRPAESLPLVAGILACVWFQIGASLRLLDLRLDHRFGRAYRAELAGGALRLVLTLGLVAAVWLAAWPALVATALGTAGVAWMARPAATATAPAGAHDLAVYRRRVLRYLLPTLPSAVYFSLQGPLTVWLAATFSGERTIAEVGALGRLGLLVGLFSGLTGTVLLPRLARITDERLYRARYMEFGALLLGLALAILAAAAAAPGPFLWLLGAHYAGLDRELLLVVAGAGLTLLGGYAVSVNLQRSWTRWHGLAVVVLIALQASLVAVLPLATTGGVVLFGTLSAAIGLALQLTITQIAFRRPRWMQWA